MKLELSQQSLEKSSNIKFHGNTTSGSQVVPCGQMGGWTDMQADRHDEANSFAIL
jgi:hypothetical protein